jgi:hypothetical protein
MEVRLYRDRANTRPELAHLWQHLLDGVGTARPHGGQHTA